MSIKVKNVSPFGHLDVPLLGRVVEAGEVVDVHEDHAALLLVQPFHYAPGDPGAEKFLKALLEAAGLAQVAAAGVAGAAGIEVLRNAANDATGEGEPA